MATPHGIEQIASTQNNEDYDEKKGASQERVVEFQDGRSRRRPADYVSSVTDRFTKHNFTHYTAKMMKFGRFVGPGTIITVAYIDPDNYQTDVASGATFEYKLLFMILVSNIVSMYLQVGSHCQESQKGAYMCRQFL
jgi:metal iron transporter